MARLSWKFGLRPQKSLYEAKKRVSNTTPKKFLGSYERVFMVTKIQISKINCKIKSILSRLVTRALLFSNIRRKSRVFPILQNLTHMGFKMHCTRGDYPDGAFRTKSGLFGPSDDIFRGPKGQICDYLGRQNSLICM